MNGSPQDDLALEQATNETYLRLCRDKSLRGQAITAAVARNSKWTQSYGKAGTELVSHPLVGRVQLNSETDLLDASSFYIGPQRIDEDGLVVVGWAAEIARTFFEEDADAYELSPNVVLRRTLSSSGYDIVDLADEWVPGVLWSGLPFAESRALSIPALPDQVLVAAAPARPVPPPPPSEMADIEQPPAPTRAARIPQPREPQGTPTKVRAKKALLWSLSAPRTVGLSAVLATLQPDQYALVTAPSDKPLIVQGHAGTGKTIVASHRSVFLVNEDRRGEADKRVLLIGPSAEYAQHVEGIVRALDPKRRVTVRGLQEWMLETAGLTYLTDDVAPDADDLAGWIPELCDRAAQALARDDHDLSARRLSPSTMATVYEAVRANRVGGEALSEERTVLRWSARLPAYQTAKSKRCHLPLLTAVALAIRPVARTGAFQHIIVDEAQDISRLEWELLRRVNPSNRWTIVGDMNQRGTDWAIPGWKQLTGVLHLNGADETVESTEINRGYRSTQAIMRFAGRLLPEAQRTVDSLQVDGPEPDVRRTNVKSLMARTAVAAEDLKLRYIDGRVAVIAVDTGKVAEGLGHAGWRPMLGDPHAWAKGSIEIHLYAPHQARGLEFDGVVVVEPSAFPKARNTDGPLYTSLTRANRALTVVHARALPKALRAATTHT